MSLPAVTFTTDDQHHRYGMGPLDKVPVQPVFDSLQTSFIIDRKADIAKFFYEWSMLIGNYDTRKSDYYLGEYANDYQTNAYVAVFDEGENQLMEYRFVNVYPYATSEVQMDWSDLDQPILLNVTFNYREFTLTTKSAASQINNLLSTFDAGLAGATHVPLNILDQIF